MGGKVCTGCNLEKTLDAFSQRRNGRGEMVHISRCKQCRCDYAKAKYDSDSPEQKAYRADVTRRFWDRIWVQVRERKEVPCADCGVSYPHYVMDFDHRPDEIKLFGIANARGQSRTLEEIMVEIDKCDVVCANCHRERTHDRANPSGEIAA